MSSASLTERANIQGTLTFFVVATLAWQPIRDVFIDSPSRALLLNRLWWFTVLLASGGALFRALRIHWAVLPPLSILALGATLRNMANAEIAGVRAAGGLAPHTDQPWYRYALLSAQDALAEVDRIKSPATALFGFSAVVLVLVGLLLIISHILTFEIQGVFESLVPPAAILAVASALSPGQGGSNSSRRWAIAFVLAAGAHVIADADRKRRHRTRWLNGQGPTRSRSLLAMATFLIMLVGLSSVLSSRLGQGPLDRRVDWRSRVPRVRQLDSPTISLRKRLVDLATTPMFHVDSRDTSGVVVQAYWRQAALDRFDGTNWSQSARRYERLEEGDAVPNDQPTTGRGISVRQTVTIDGLVDAWLPSAFQATRLVKAPRGARVSVDPSTGSLIVSSKTTRSLTYRIESTVPVVPASASPRPTDDLTVLMTALPNGVSQEIRFLAREIVGPAGNDVVGQARLLENFFLQNFTYSTDKSWTGSNPLDNFVLNDRTGYCEQFAGSFAAMARAVGIPARVAVGFTPGKVQPDGSFVVTGENAHAWPEVLIAGTGWVPFEPTPGRGLLAGDLDTLESLTQNTLPSPPTSTPVVSSPEPVVASKPNAGTGIWFGALVVVALVIAILAVWFLRPAQVRRRNTHRRRRVLLEGVPADRQELEWAWDQLVVQLRERQPVIAPRVPSSTPRTPRTPRDVCDWARSFLDDEHHNSLIDIANTLTAARFAPPRTVEATSIDAATSAAHLLREQLRADANRSGSADTRVGTSTR